MEMIYNEATAEITGDIFDTVFDTLYVLKLLTDDNTSSDLLDSSFKIKVPKPEYDSTWDNEEEEQLADTKFKIDTAALNLGSDRDAFMGFEIDFAVHPEYDVPDVLKIRLTLDAPAEALPDGYFVSQWA